MVKIKFPGAIVAKVEKHLKKREKDTKKRLESISKEDPFLDPERVSDNAATDTEVKEQEGHERIQALKFELTKNLIRIRKALTKVKLGKYGICEECKKMIDTDRLAIDPTATLCVECRKKHEEKNQK